MPKRYGNYPMLTALLLGGWATVYIGAVVLAVESFFPALVKILPPLQATLTLELIPTYWIYLAQRDLQ